jgi:putative membrane protein
MNTTPINPIKRKKAKDLIIAVSIVIPLAVAALFKIKIENINLSFLPAIYAGINALTAITLIGALRAIKRKNKELHRKLIRFALLLSIVFLLLYVLYHIFSDSTLYGDTNHDGSVDVLEKVRIGFVAYIYYFLLLTHILLSVAVIPIVLFTYLFAWEGNFEKHKRWARYAFPIWLYVAVTGVIVYFMISPFYK